MPDLLFIADAPHIALDAEAGTTRRVQIAKTGKFKDPRYGEFSITRSDFAKWIANFQALSAPEAGRAGLPIDVDHGPEKRGETDAAGWITKLDTLGADGSTSTPDELWATAEWNALGVELVGGHRYRYLSPSYQHDFKDETGRSHGTALVGVGLTNRPFLTMATVSLSAEPLVASAIAIEPADSRAPMSLPKTILDALGLDEDAADEKALEAITALQARPEKDKTLAQLASESGSVVLSKEDFITLKAGSEAGLESSKKLAELTFETEFDKALDKGQATPAMKESFSELFALDQAAAIKALQALPEGIHMSADGTSGSDADGGEISDRVKADAGSTPIDEERARLDARATQLAAEHNIDYVTALDRAVAEMGV